MARTDYRAEVHVGRTERECQCDSEFSDYTSKWFLSQRIVEHNFGVSEYDISSK